MIMVLHTNKLKESLNFWNISMKSLAGGGLALMVSIPSVKKYRYYKYI